MRRRRSPLNYHAGRTEWTLSDQTLREAAHIEVQIAVVIIVNKSETRVGAIALKLRSSSDVFERSILFVVEQHDPAIRAKRQIRRPIVIVVSRSATTCPESRVKPGFLGHILKPAVSEVVVKTNSPFRPIVCDK